MATFSGPADVSSHKRANKYPVNTIFLGVAFILVLAFLAIVAAMSQQSALQIQTANQAVIHTHEVLEKLGAVSANLIEVESSARSFAISGKQSHLNPFYTAANEVPLQVDELKALFQGEPEGLKTLDEIQPLIEKHLQTMKELVALGDKNLFRGFSQRGLTDEGNTLMEQIQAKLGPLEQAQKTRLTKERVEEADLATRVQLVSLGGSILAGIIILACSLLALRAKNARRKAEEKLEQLLGSMPDSLILVNAEGKIVGSNVHAEKLFGYSDRELRGESMALLVPERFRQDQRQYYAGYFSQRGGRLTSATIELCGLHKDGQEFPIEVSTKPLASENGLTVTTAIRDISERKQVEKQIAKLNKELERRALELENANKELEAFSYSVSHDLRSPLQNIDSFSLILMQDYANRLDPEGRDYIQRLRGSCQHMEQIIDALLALSNMMRNELLIDHFDLTAVAHAVATDLKQKNPDRIVDWVIAEGLSAEGDAQLIRVVLENLLGNSWKFTANRPRARIEFGTIPQPNGARTYFVRDDGAGFDMTRANNLFTPFKRLHDQSQFRGTGIGLATVQRVIHRHRGKIWAEGVVDQGATFCFTLTGETGETNGNHPPSPASN